MELDQEGGALKRAKDAQLDEAHSKRRPGQVEWIHTALAMRSLFVLWVAFGARTTETAAGLIAQVVACLQRIPVFLTDGWKCYPVALIQVLGRVYRPRRKGKVGRFPKPRLVAPDGLSLDVDIPDIQVDQLKSTDASLGKSLLLSFTLDSPNWISEGELLP